MDCWFLEFRGAMLKNLLMADLWISKEVKTLGTWEMVTTHLSLR